MKTIRSICMQIFGLSQEDAKTIQRIWFFLPPPLFTFLTLENPGTRPAGWALFAVLLVISFWDGLHGWEWGKKWLWGIALYSVIVAAALFLVGNQKIAEFLSSLPFLEFLSPLLFLLAFPLLWPATLTKASDHLFHSESDIAIVLSFWGLWLLLLAAYSIGAFLKGRNRSV